MRTPTQTSEEPGGVVQRSQRGKILLFCVLLFSAVLGLVLLIVFTVIPCNLEICNTTTCLLLLARFLKAHNDTIDPCEDFFNYTCGNWDANYTWGMNMPLMNVFDVLLEENQLIMKRLLEEPQLRVNSSAEDKAVRFYKSCMNTEQIEARGAQPLKELINEVGGWNITGSWNETDFNQTLQILMGQYNTFPFFKAYVGPSFSDPRMNIIQIDHPEFELPSETDFKKTVKYPQILRSYYSYLMKLALLMGGKEDITSTYISLAFSFISNLQKVVTPLKKRQEKKMLFYFTTIRELQEKAPAIDWLSCLQAAFHPVKLNMSQSIAVHDMDYLQGMSQLIEQWKKKRDVLQIYMILCLVGNLSPALNKQFQEAHWNLTDMLYSGTTELQRVRSERWRKCLSEASTFFAPVLGKMVVQEIFPQKTKDLVESRQEDASLTSLGRKFQSLGAATEKFLSCVSTKCTCEDGGLLQQISKPRLAEQIFSEIQDAIHNHLDHVEWMGYQSRQEAKEKIHSLQVEIGYPEKIFQTNEVDDEYLKLDIYEDNFFHNVVACLKSLRKRFSLKLSNSHLQDDWEVAPWSVHSYYSLRRHAVVFPAGMFRSPFFHTEFPSAVNFGAMGFFMAHELLHSFYDYVLTKNCSACDMKALVESTECLVKQYESYSLEDHPINGSFTLLENAADTEGLSIAYQAYQNWLAKQRRVKKLPWPGLSHHQLFFISFAHAMCGHTRLKGLQTFLHRDPHSPPSFRVLGTLSNSQDFSKLFHCPSKSRMNPALKCHIW